MPSDESRHALGKRHFKIVVADGPSHRVLGVVEHASAAGRDAPSASWSGWLRHADKCGSSVGEQRVGDHFLRVPLIMIVEAAQFHGAKQDARSSIRCGKAAGDPKSIERTMAAHEADV